MKDGIYVNLKGDQIWELREGRIFKFDLVYGENWLEYINLTTSGALALLENFIYLGEL